MEERSAEEKREKAQVEIGSRKYEEQQRIERNRETDLQREFNMFIQLMRKAYQWDQAQLLRNYIRDLENGLDDFESDEYIEWAYEKANWLDPTIRLKDRKLARIREQHAKLLAEALAVTYYPIWKHI